MTSNIFIKITTQLLLITFFNSICFAQNSVSKLISCPSNSEGLQINFSKIVDNQGVTKFELKNINPNSTFTHANN